MEIALTKNNKVMILAYTIAIVRNIDNYAWFGTLHCVPLSSITNIKISLILDRQIGLFKGVTKIFSKSVYTYYCFYLKRQSQGV
jgi:hypothetical protein